MVEQPLRFLSSARKKGYPKRKKTIAKYSHHSSWQYFYFHVDLQKLIQQAFWRGFFSRKKDYPFCDKPAITRIHLPTAFLAPAKQTDWPNEEFHMKMRAEHGDSWKQRMCDQTNMRMEQGVSFRGDLNIGALKETRESFIFCQCKGCKDLKYEV